MSFANLQPQINILFRSKQSQAEYQAASSRLPAVCCCFRPRVTSGRCLFLPENHGASLANGFPTTSVLLLSPTPTPTPSPVVQRLMFIHLTNSHLVAAVASIVVGVGDTAVNKTGQSPPLQRKGQK